MIDYPMKSRFSKRVGLVGAPQTCRRPMIPVQVLYEIHVAAGI
jgi:hypothetical protein